VKRGTVVSVAAKGYYSGKPRPALVIQSDLFRDLNSVALCLISSDIVDAPLLRVTVEPTAVNGLRQTSQIMIDKLVTVPRTSIGDQIGSLDDAVMLQVSRSLMLFLAIAS
jgi:mRNA interferase MazF